jgi:very-short-patch-repair endonuclease
LAGHNPMTDAAKKLRQRQTEAERKLWFKLRDKQLGGVKFRRQELIGKYVVDFVSFEKKLILEVDGSPHKENEVKMNDRQRTSWLQSEGFKVLRFWNADVMNNVESVINRIKENLK